MVDSTLIPYILVSSQFQSMGMLTLNLKHLYSLFFENCFIFMLLYSFMVNLIYKKIVTYEFLFLFFIFFNMFFKDNLIIFNKTFTINWVSKYFKIISFIFIINFFFFFKTHYKNSFSRNKEKEFFNYFLIIFFFLLFLIKSSDLISFFITLESSTLILIALIFLQKHNTSNKESGFKFFFLHSLASSCFLLGLITFLFLFKTTNYSTILYYIIFCNHIFKLYINIYIYSILINVSILSFFFFFFFKFSIFPCHFWIDSFYEGSSLLLLLFYSVIYKIAIFSLFLKFYFFLIIKIKFLLLIFLFFTIIYGSHLAFIQKKIRKFWAYSTVNNFGFFFFCTIFCNYFWGLQLGFFFIYIYMVLSLLFFLIIFNTRNILTGNYIYYISHFTFLSNKEGKLLTTVLFLSLAGIPPFIGFFSKFFLFSGIVFINYILIFFIIITYTIYSALYYLRIIKQIFFIQLKKNNKKYYFFSNFSFKLITYIYFFFLTYSFKEVSKLFVIFSYLINYLTTL